MDVGGCAWFVALAGVGAPPLDATQRMMDVPARARFLCRTWVCPHGVTAVIRQTVRSPCGPDPAQDLLSRGVGLKVEGCRLPQGHALSQTRLVLLLVPPAYHGFSQAYYVYEPSTDLQAAHVQWQR